MLTTLLLLSALLAQDAPRIGSQPTRVCAVAPKAIFQVENPGDAPLFVVLSVDRWSADGDDEWDRVQEDVTQREALSKKARSTRLDPQTRRDFVWDLKGRKGPPPLVTGRHRLVVAYFDPEGRNLGQVVHAFVIADCQY